MSYKVRLRVKEIAQQQGLSEYELAARSGLDVRVVRRMIANQGVPQMMISQLAKMAEGLRCHIADMIEDRICE